MRQKSRAKLVRQCKPPKSSAQWRDRIIWLRNQRESDANSHWDSAAISLVESAYRQPLQHIRPNDAIQLFLACVTKRAFNEAELLALTVQSGSTKLAMWERLNEVRPTRLVESELQRTRIAYPNREPDALVRENDTSPRRQGFAQYVAMLADHPDRFSWKQALELALKDRPSQSKVLELPRQGQIIWEALNGNLKPFFNPLLEPQDFTKLGETLARSGQPVPTELAELADEQAQHGVSIRLLSDPHNSRWQDAFRARLSALSSGEQEEWLRLLSAGCKALSDDRVRVVWGVVTDAEVDGSAIAAVWVERMLRDDGNIRPLFSAFLRSASLPPRRYAAHRKNIQLALDEGRLADDFSDWWNSRITELPANAVSSCRDLEGESNPYHLIGYFFQDIADRTEDFQNDFKWMLRRLTPGAFDALASFLAFAISDRKPRSRRVGLIRETLLASEALVYELSDGRQRLVELAKALESTSPKRALSIVSSLPEGRTASRLTFLWAYQQRDVGRMKSAASELDLRELGDAMAAAIEGRRLDVVRHWRAASQSSFPELEDTLWVTLGFWLSIKGETESIARFLNEDPAPRSRRGKALYRSWRVAAGALSESEQSKCDVNVHKAILGDAAERNVALQRLWSTTLPSISDQRAIRNLLPPLEGDVFSALQSGATICPFNSRRSIVAASTGLELLEAINGSPLGGHDPHFCSLAVNIFFETGRDQDVAKTILEMPATQPQDRVRLLLQLPPSRVLASTVKQMSVDDLAEFEDQLVRQAIVADDPHLTDVLSDKSVFWELRLNARIPCSPYERQSLRKLLRKASSELRRNEKDDIALIESLQSQASFFWTKRARARFDELRESHPSIARLIGRAILKLASDTGSLSPRGKSGTRLFGLGRSAHRFRVIFERKDGEIRIYRVYPRSEHTQYERDLNDSLLGETLKKFDASVLVVG